MKTRTRHGKQQGRDPNQIEFGIVWDVNEYPFKLRAGDVFKIDNRLCRVVRVNECSAVVSMRQPVRDFKTRFDKPVRFQPPPKQFRVSPNAEVIVLNPRSRR